MARRLTQAQLARELEVSRQAIHKHVVAGTLAVGEDGLIDFDAAQAAMRTLHPGAKTVQALPGAAPQPAAPEAPAATHVVIPAQATHLLGNADEHGMPTNYHIARTLREAEEARMARLKREEMEGQLIRLEAVRSVVVAPSLTPDSYTTPLCVVDRERVVAPSLTPDSYTPLVIDHLHAGGCSSLSHPG